MVASGVDVVTAAAGVAAVQGSAGLDGSRELPQIDDRERQVWRVLESVPDPEIPILSVVDLGIVRHVRWLATGDGKSKLHVGITPTYSGCPATEVIRHSIATALEQEGYVDAVLEEVLSPPWSSDWLTEEGRRKLAAFGIAPPERSVANPRHLFGDSCCGVSAVREPGYRAGE